MAWAMSAIRIFSGFGSSGQNRRPEKVPMKPSRLFIRRVEHGSRVRTIPPGRAPGRSRIGASIGAGRAETAGLSNLDETGIPASPVVEGSQSERAARSPQVDPQPTHPVHQNAAGHRDVAILQT